MEIKSFRDLRVWQAGMDLTVQVYALTRGFPPDERYGLTSQIRRAAISLPSNIAEGYARESTGEYLYHISVAQGSLAELETQLDLSARLGYLKPGDLMTWLAATSSLRRQLFALRNALEKRTQPKGSS
jgi:four helix bundle protein